MEGWIFSGVICGLCALVVICIGISQLVSKEPVGFYTGGEKPLRASQLSDVKAWNRKHGWMWIIYGVCTVLAWLCGMMIGDSIVACVPFVIGFLGPLVFMVL